MKHLFFLLALFAAYALHAKIDTTEIPTKISRVTVFLRGAEISRSAEIRFSKGQHTFVIFPLPAELDKQSIQVKALDNTKILSVKHEIIAPDPLSAGAAKSETDAKIRIQEVRIKEVENKLNVYAIEEKLLLDNSRLGSDTKGTTVAEIKSAAEFYRSKLNEIRQNQLNLSVQLDDLKEELRQLLREINENRSKAMQPFSKVFVTVEVERELSGLFEMNYYVESAGWEPTYDFRVSDITEPLAITYQANVYQSTGEIWDKAKITLSSSNPSLGGSAPELEPWILGQSRTKPTFKSKESSGELVGKVTDQASGEPLPFVNVELMSNGIRIAGTSTDFDGFYRIKPISAGNCEIQFSYIGYQSKSLTNYVLKSGVKNFLDIALTSNDIELEEVEVNGYKTPLIQKDAISSTVTEIQKMPTRTNKSMAQSVSGLNVRGSRTNSLNNTDQVLSTDQLVQSINAIANSIEYQIELPYTIQPDGQDTRIKIKEKQVAVDYTYRAIPRLDNGVFLSAAISNWSELNLLSGKANIFFQGTFTGETSIDATTTGDTLTVYLGRDKGILVERTGKKALNDRVSAGNFIKQDAVWEVTLRNNKLAPISIRLEDQYPISPRKSVEVELVSNGGAKVNARAASLEWVLNLAPGEKKTVSYKYSVRYPSYNRFELD